MIVQDLAGGTPTVEAAATWKDGLGLTYTVLADVDGMFYSTYGNEQDVFVFYIIDRDGVITWRALREESDTLEQVQREVEALLAE